MIKILSGFTEILSEHKGQLKKIWVLAVNDLIKKYKGAVMGPLWAIIKPTFTLFILWFAFTVGIRGSGTVSGYPRFIFMLSGYIPWFFISEGIVGGARSIRQNSQFVTKLSFPVSNIMTFCSLASLIVHLGMCVINSIMTGLFWLSGIFWDTYDVKNPVLRTLMYFNPINYFINGYRKSFLYETAIFDSNYTTELIVFYGEFILLILIGSHFYKKLRKILPDIL